VSITAGVRRIVGESFTYVYGYGDLGARAKTEADACQAQEAQPWLPAAADARRSLEDQLLTKQRHAAIEPIVLRYGGALWSRRAHDTGHPAG